MEKHVQTLNVPTESFCRQGTEGILRTHPALEHGSKGRRGKSTSGTTVFYGALEPKFSRVSFRASHGEADQMKANRKFQEVPPKRNHRDFLKSRTQSSVNHAAMHLNEDRQFHEHQPRSAGMLELLFHVDRGFLPHVNRVPHNSKGSFGGFLLRFFVIFSAG